MTAPRSRLAVAAVASSAFAVLALAEATQVFIGLSLLDAPVSWTWALRSTVPSWGLLVVLVVPLLWWLDGSPSRPTHPRRIALHGAVGLAFALTHLAGSAFLGELTAPEPIGFMARGYQLASVYFVVDLLTYVAIIGVHYAVRREQADARRDAQAARLLADVSEARLLALEGRLRPDFFFNALNAVSGLLARGDPAKGAAALSSLGSLIRTSLASPKTRTALETEMELVAHYLTIQGLRFPDRLQSTWCIDGEVAGATFPPLLLVQLVEAIVDGGLERGDPFFLEVTARRHSTGLDVRLDHSAPPLAPDGVLRLAIRRLATFEPRGDLVVEAGGTLSLRFSAYADEPPTSEASP